MNGSHRSSYLRVFCLFFFKFFLFFVFFAVYYFFSFSLFFHFLQHRQKMMKMKAIFSTNFDENWRNPCVRATVCLIKLYTASSILLHVISSLFDIHWNSFMNTPFNMNNMGWSLRGLNDGYDDVEQSNHGRQQGNLNVVCWLSPLHVGIPTLIHLTRIYTPNDDLV